MCLGGVWGGVHGSVLNRSGSGLGRNRGTVLSLCKNSVAGYSLVLGRFGGRVIVELVENLCKRAGGIIVAVFHRVISAAVGRRSRRNVIIRLGWLGLILSGFGSYIDPRVRVPFRIGGRNSFFGGGNVGGFWVVWFKENTRVIAVHVHVGVVVDVGWLRDHVVGIAGVNRGVAIGARGAVVGRGVSCGGRTGVGFIGVSVVVWLEINHLVRGRVVVGVHVICCSVMAVAICGESSVLVVAVGSGSAWSCTGREGVGVGGRGRVVVEAGGSL